jgi:hypothetical protein
MANSDLIKGAGQVYATETGDMGASLVKSIKRGAQQMQLAAEAKKREKANINARTASYINRLDSNVDISELDQNQQSAITEFLVKGRNDYAYSAGIVAKLNADDPRYIEEVAKMNNIQLSFRNLANNVNTFKKDKSEFLQDFDNGMLSDGNEVNTLGEASNIYTTGGDFKVGNGGVLEFYDASSGSLKSYSDINKPFLKDFAAADAILKMNEALYKSGQSLTGARRNMIEQRLKNLISKGGRNTLMSLASDDFIMEGGLGLQDPMLFEPENQDALRQAVLDGYMNVLDASAAQGAADKAPKTGAGGKSSLSSLSNAEQREYNLRSDSIIKKANDFINMEPRKMAEVLNYITGKSNFITKEQQKELEKEQLGKDFDEAAFDKEYENIELFKFYTTGSVPIPEDIKDPNAAFALYVYNTDLKDNVADYLIQNLKTIEPTKSDNPVDTSKYNK